MIILRLSKELFIKQPLTFVVLQYYGSTDLWNNLMTKFTTSSRTIWNESKQQWLWSLSKWKQMLQNLMILRPKLCNINFQLFKNWFRIWIDQGRINQLAKYLDNIEPIDILSSEKSKIEFLPNDLMNESKIHEANEVLNYLDKLCKSIKRHRDYYHKQSLSEPIKLDITTIEDDERCLRIVWLPSIFTIRSYLTVGNAMFISKI